MNLKSDYNIIPIGDHCAIGLALDELKLRNKSYPFDWVVNREELYETNIIHNVNIIRDLDFEPIQNIVKKYIGDAFENNNKVNSTNNMWFPHDHENITDIFEKYERRFERLQQDLNKKNIFILLTRHYYIEEETFNKIMNILLRQNNGSIILFMSGTNHTYFDDNEYEEKVIFNHIYYDVTQFSAYDYHTFRPNIKIYLSELLK